MPRFMTQTIKPVGLCPQCKQVPRVPGRTYCAACTQELNREKWAKDRRAKRAARARARPVTPTTLD